MSTKPYDQAFKFLAEQDAEALLLLLGDLQPGEQAKIELLPREVSVSTQLPDQPYEVVTADERRLVHVEAQTVYDPRLPERMVEYGVRLWLKYRLPMASYALLLTRRGVPKRLQGASSIVAGNLRLALRYTIVRLWRLSAASALKLQRASLLPFVPLMQGGAAELEAGARALGEVADEGQRRELSLHFLLLGGLRYNREDILELVGRESMIAIEQLKESSFYQYIVEEGLREGIEKGIQLGIQQGIQQGEVALLRRQLERRFGAVPEWAVQKIEAADRATLEEWGVRLLNAQSLEDLLR